MSKTAPKDRFKTNLLALIDNIAVDVEDANQRGYVGANQIMMDGIKFFMDGKPSEVLIEQFIKNSHNHWLKIHTRKDKDFLECITTLFGTIKVEGLDNNVYMGQLLDLYNNYFSRDSKDYVWDYLHGFIKISIHYIHEGRKPVINDANQKGYVNPKFHQEVDIKTYGNMFDVQLAFTERFNPKK